MKKFVQILTIMVFGGSFLTISCTKKEYKPQVSQQTNINSYTHSQKIRKQFEPDAMPLKALPDRIL